MMKSKITLLTAMMFALVFFACSGDENKIYLKTPVSYHGKNYKAVLIGTQTWLAENLNYETPVGSLCYGEEESNCEKYGRLYDWATAMNLPAECNESSCSDKIVHPHRGICPEGWHLPSEADWNILTNYAGGRKTAAIKLKAGEGWEACGATAAEYYPCLDTYGFAALPGGSGSDVGTDGYWWTSAEYNGDDAYRRSMNYSGETIVRDAYSKNRSYSVRCVKDE